MCLWIVLLSKNVEVRARQVVLLYAPNLREAVQEASWQTRKKPVRTRFAVVLRTTVNTAALRVKALEIPSSLTAIADMKIAAAISKSGKSSRTPTA
jgi:hypothetical protein